jgi:hypothetical protein
MRTEAIEAISSYGTGLRVDFVARGDRYGHVISLIDADDGVQPLVESIEGLPDDAWPASPALQNLSVETLHNGRRVALLVGMAGGSHWSASIEAVPNNAELIFDLACRHTRTPTWLGSRYRSLSDVTPKLIFRADGETVSDQKGLTIKPASILNTASTTRWKFSIGLKIADS